MCEDKYNFSKIDNSYTEYIYIAQHIRWFN